MPFNKSFQKRYFSTLLFNIVNSFINFLTSIIIVRTLSPIEYGNYQFLVSIFVAIFTFANLNSQNGYFTFISQKKESYKFYKHYLLWEFIQFSFVGLSIIGIIASGYNLFLNIEAGLIALAFISIYLTKNIRELIVNTFESTRATHYYLYFIFTINLINLALITLLKYYDALNVKTILSLSIAEYSIFFMISLYVFLKHKDTFINSDKTYSFRDNFQKYSTYTKPLFISSLIAFSYLFLERWLLQKYGGADQQAFYSLAIQFSSIILILTTSMLKIFWKEIAEYIHKKDYVHLNIIFSSSIENIFFITTIISLFFAFNAKEIILILYGNKYIAAETVFVLMNLYTIHQTLGQLYGTFMLAAEETKVYSIIGIFFTLIALPFILFAVLPKQLYGLNLGAVGIASVMIIIQLFSVNSLGYYIKRKYNFDSIFLFQIKHLARIAMVFFLINYLADLLFVNSYLHLFFEGGITLITFLIIYYNKSNHSPTH